MIRGKKTYRLILLLAMGLMLAGITMSCSKNTYPRKSLRKKKCDCPQWTMQETRGQKMMVIG